MNCAQCRRNLEEDGIEPDCENCKKPELLPENATAWETFQVCLGRDPLGFSCLNYEALRFFFDLHKFNEGERIACYRKILICERALRQHQEATANAGRNEK